ncbi:ATP-binding cassette domain-containing protein [Micromonospora sp. NPDC005173]|uniref:ATP-binding cassette domain-containing protein n=1 Tax=Micromonospora sp. NPDC005173 TaxID=3157165 RepID=UPI0033BF0622
MDVTLTGLSVRFDSQAVPALESVDLQVRAGEQVALLGSSGAGKSTLLRVLLGGVRPLAGEVRVGGRDPFGPAADVRALRQRAGFLRQRDDLVPGVSARTNILMGQSWRWRVGDWLTVARGGVPRRHTARLDELAHRHGIIDLLDRRIEHLSGGQRQRVALVRALLGGPGLLLADESTTGLDPERAAAAVADLRGADGVTLLLATHDGALARQFPRVVGLRAGRIVADGPPDTISMEQLYAA